MKELNDPMDASGDIHPGSSAQPTPELHSAKDGSHPPAARSNTALRTSDDMKDLILALLVLGIMLFALGFLMMAVDRPTPYSGSITLFYTGMCIAGLGGVGLTAGLVGILIRLALQSPASK
jgi:hypothetical protein